MALSLGVRKNQRIKIGESVLTVIQGTVEFSSIEGGWWFLRADSGETYTPTNLSSEFKVPGIRVRATLVVQADVVGFVPGPFVVISRIERLPAASRG